MRTLIGALFFSSLYLFIASFFSYFISTRQELEHGATKRGSIWGHRFPIIVLVYSLPSDHTPTTQPPRSSQSHHHHPLTPFDQEEVWRCNNFSKCARDTQVPQKSLLLFFLHSSGRGNGRKGGGETDTTEKEKLRQEHGVVLICTGLVRTLYYFWSFFFSSLPQSMAPKSKRISHHDRQQQQQHTSYQDTKLEADQQRETEFNGGGFHLGRVSGRKGITGDTLLLFLTLIRGATRMEIGSLGFSTREILWCG